MEEEVKKGPPTDKETEGILSADELKQSELLKLFSTKAERALAVKLLPKILPILTARANQLADANMSRDLTALKTRILEENKKALEEKIEEFRKAITPMSPDEISTLLNQEYAEFPIKIGKNGSGKQFTIRELPLSAETKVLKAVKRSLADKVQVLTRLDWSSSQTAMERVSKMIDLVPEVVETLAECVAICLDPFSEDSSITPDWVLKSMGTQKMFAILQAQLEAGKYRDFLSGASRLIRQQMMG